MADSVDEARMRLALAEAKLAEDRGEVPVGAVIFRNGKLICRAHNRCEELRDATAHAELLAIREASRLLGSKRLCDCILYVTMEPCPMCTGGAVLSRIGKIVFGVKDPRAGACGSLLCLPSYPLECTPKVEGGVLAEESAALLRRFFLARRNGQKKGGVL